jgi:[acyl-carrier-protein] S-malonyltransferase
MKIAYLFVGQGSQKVGMGKEVYDRYASSKAVFDSAKTDFNLIDTTFNGPDEVLNNTAYTQVCLLVTSLAIAAALDEEGFKAQGVAGLSLGEYSALTYTKALSLEKALPLVRTRGQIMASALPQGTSSMSAVLSDKLDIILETLKENNQGIVEIANYNSPTQFVLSGEINALRDVETALKAKEVTRIIPLKVSGAFHSSLLNDASTQLKPHLISADLKAPVLPVYFNVSGKPETDLVDALTKQICHSVQWVKTIQTMISDGYDTFIEIGPGKTLAGLVRQIDPSVAVYSVETLSSIEKIKGELIHD